MSKIILGTSNEKNIAVDLETLLDTRLLVQANSGGGKSWLLRRLAEQLFGKIPVIIIDPEGEFATLREKFDFVLVGEGGEVAADERSAPLLAETLLKLKACAVIDLFETYRKNPMGRHLWVKAFLSALLDAPKSLRHPTVLIIDEAHMFCPEQGDSPAEGVMVGISTAGRKRGICSIWATQRLALLDKSASSQLQNRMVGLTFEDVDVIRAENLLSISPEDKHKFKAQVKVLEPGQFFAFGRAISKERILVNVGSVGTSHPKIGSTSYTAGPPPTPAKILELLPKLADLPKTAEEKAKTIAEFKTEIRSLKAQLRTQPTTPAQVPVFDTKQIERATRDVKAQAEKQVATVHADMKRLHAKGNQLAKALQALAESAIKQFDVMNLSEIGTWPKDFDETIKHRWLTTQSAFTVSRPPHKISDRLPTRPTDIEPTNGDLKGPHKAILKALGELLSIGRAQAPKPMVAAWAGYSPGGGAFMNPLGALRSWGLIDYPTPGNVALTDAGRQQVGPCEPPDQEEIHRRVRDVLRGPERKILSVLLERGPDTELSKADLASAAGYAEKGGAFMNPLGALRTAGFVTYPRAGFVRASDWLFLD